MQRIVYMPESPAAARAKLREGLADWWGFVVSAPCLAICWVAGRLHRSCELALVDLKLHPVRAVGKFAYWVVFSLLPTLGFYLGFPW